MKTISVKEFKAQQKQYILLDVREHKEVTFAKIEPHLHIPMEFIPLRYSELKKEKKYVVMCHSGVRSAHVCLFLERNGYDVLNLEGGIDAWSRYIDPEVPRY